MKIASSRDSYSLMEQKVDGERVSTRSATASVRIVAFRSDADSKKASEEGWSSNLLSGNRNNDVRVAMLTETMIALLNCRPEGALIQ
jgi:hypothetical protein